MKKESRIFDILDVYPEKWPEQKVALAKKQNGVWVKYTPEQYQEITKKIANAFIESDIQPGDRVAIISSNRPEWNMIDMAIMEVGAITVPIYPTISKEDYLFILNDCGAKIAFVEGVAVMNKIDDIMPQLPELKTMYTFQDRGEHPYLDQFIELGTSHPHDEELEQRKAAAKPADCATIIYTSGTTGVPKGVMLSHSNIMNQLFNLEQTPDKKSKTAFSFLPICHAYERTIVYLYQYLGMSVYYAEGLATIGSDMKDIHPTMMSAVPRLLEKMYDKIIQSGSKKKGLAGAIFRWSVRLTEHYRIDPDERSWWYNWKLGLADKLVYSKIRENLGAEHFDIIISGAASIQPKIAAFFSAIKMPVYEGYGMTETSPVIATSSNVKYGREVGSVGPALPGIELRIADNGEILCRGHNVMMGYYKNEELTREVIDKDGWFHTGDLGHINEHGQTFITGRLKNLFKTSMGKYVNPQTIEDKFGESEFIENIVVFGEGQKYAASLIVPDFNSLKLWCEDHGIKITAPAEMINLKEVKDLFAKEIKRLNGYFGDTEKIKKYTLIPDEWTMGNDMLTPTLKVRRKNVQKKYEKEINELFV